MTIDIHVALQYIIDHPEELLKADEDLLDSADVLLTLTRWEKADIARVVQSYDEIYEDMDTDVEIDPDLLLQQSEEYERNITQLRKTPPEDTQ